MGELFEKSGFSNTDGDIDNLLNPFNGWRIPTATEWESIVGTTRTGSTVNGTPGCHWAVVKLNNVEHAEEDAIGLLVFPDGNNISGFSLTLFDGEKDEYVEIANRNLTESDLNNFLSQGCVFLPASGYYMSSDDWYGYQDDLALELSYQTCVEESATQGCYFVYGDAPNIDVGNKGGNSLVRYMPVRLIKSTE